MPSSPNDESALSPPELMTLLPEVAMDLDAEESSKKLEPVGVDSVDVDALAGDDVGGQAAAASGGQAAAVPGAAGSSSPQQHPSSSSSAVSAQQAEGEKQSQTVSQHPAVMRELATLLNAHPSTHKRTNKLRRYPGEVPWSDTWDPKLGTAANWSKRVLFLIKLRFFVYLPSLGYLVFCGGLYIAGANWAAHRHMEWEGRIYVVCLEKKLEQNM